MANPFSQQAVQHLPALEGSGVLPARNSNPNMRSRIRFCIRAILTLACAVLFSASALAAPQAGVDYILLDPQQPSRAPEGKIEVLEFFNFSCPHCFRMQAPMAKWMRDNDLSDVAVVRQPVVFPSARGHYARMFHTLEALGVAEEYYGKVFRAIHSERILLNSKGRFADWLEDQGMDADQVENIYDSFSVNSKIVRDDRIADDYGVNSTPQMAIAGKYLLQPALNGSIENMLRVAAEILVLEREARKQE